MDFKDLPSFCITLYTVGGCLHSSIFKRRVPNKDAKQFVYILLTPFPANYSVFFVLNYKFNISRRDLATDLKIYLSQQKILIVLFWEEGSKKHCCAIFTEYFSYTTRATTSSAK